MGDRMDLAPEEKRARFGTNASTPQVRCFPGRDAAFRSSVASAVREARSLAHDDARFRAAILESLRRLYPNAVVTKMDELATLHDQSSWYAFRDGRIRRDNPGRERLYESLVSARRTIADSSVILQHSRKVSEEAGFHDHPPLPGRPSVVDGSG